MKQIIILLGLLIVSFTYPVKETVKYREDYCKLLNVVETDKVSEEEILLFAAYELFRREGLHSFNPDDNMIYPYTCPAGKSTYGFGHVIRRQDKYRITVEEAVQLMYLDMMKFKGRLEVHYPDLQFNQIIALTLLSYNIGKVNFTGTNLGKEIGCDDIPTIEKYSYYNGKHSTNLAKSRKFEKLLYKGDYEKIVELHMLNIDNATKKLKRYGASPRISAYIHQTIEQYSVLGGKNRKEIR